MHAFSSPAIFSWFSRSYNLLNRPISLAFSVILCHWPYESGLTGRNRNFICSSFIISAMQRTLYHWHQEGRMRGSIRDRHFRCVQKMSTPGLNLSLADDKNIRDTFLCMRDDSISISISIYFVQETRKNNINMKVDGRAPDVHLQRPSWELTRQMTQLTHDLFSISVLISFVISRLPSTSFNFLSTPWPKKGPRCLSWIVMHWNDAFWPTT